MATTAPRSMKDCLQWLEGLEAAPEVRATGAWPLSAVLDHLAQSVEMSIDGFPQPRSVLFQQTAGRAAFAVFRMRGSMKHGLAQPIPGAAMLAAGADWLPAAQRLRAAIVRFDSYNGPLMPHFAYGALGKSDFELAHCMHIADHQREIVRGDV